MRLAQRLLVLEDSIGRIVEVVELTVRYGAYEEREKDRGDEHGERKE